MITLEAGVLRWDNTRLHDQEDRLVMIVERILRRINPAKKESQDGARTKEEEEKDGSPPRSGGRRLVFLFHSAKTSPSYCWKLVADGVGQRRVSVVVLGVSPLARKVQHSPSVEQ